MSDNKNKNDKKTATIKMIMSEISNNGKLDNTLYRGNNLYSKEGFDSFMRNSDDISKKDYYKTVAETVYNSNEAVQPDNISRTEMVDSMVRVMAKSNIDNTYLRNVGQSNDLNKRKYAHALSNPGKYSFESLDDIGKLNMSAEAYGAANSDSFGNPTYVDQASAIVVAGMMTTCRALDNFTKIDTENSSIDFAVTYKYWLNMAADGTPEAMYYPQYVRQNNVFKNQARQGIPIKFTVTGNPPVGSEDWVKNELFIKTANGSVVGGNLISACSKDPTKFSIDKDVRIGAISFRAPTKLNADPATDADWTTKETIMVTNGSMEYPTNNTNTRQSELNVVIPYVIDDIKYKARVIVRTNITVNGSSIEGRRTGDFSVTVENLSFFKDSNGESTGVPDILMTGVSIDGKLQDTFNNRIDHLQTEFSNEAFKINFEYKNPVVVPLSPYTQNEASQSAIQHMDAVAYFTQEALTQINDSRNAEAEYELERVVSPNSNDRYASLVGASTELFNFESDNQTYAESFKLYRKLGYWFPTKMKFDRTNTLAAITDYNSNKAALREIVDASVANARTTLYTSEAGEFDVVIYGHQNIINIFQDTNVEHVKNDPGAMTFDALETGTKVGYFSFNGRKFRVIGISDPRLQNNKYVYVSIVSRSRDIPIRFNSIRSMLMFTAISASNSNTHEIQIITQEKFETLLLASGKLMVEGLWDETNVDGLIEYDPSGTFRKITDNTKNRNVSGTVTTTP